MAKPQSDQVFAKVEGIQASAPRLPEPAAEPGRLAAAGTIAKRLGAGTRMATLLVAVLSGGTTGVLLLVWLPIVVFPPAPGLSFRPMMPAFISAHCLAIGTVPGVLVGLGQLFWRPRGYGLLSLAISALPYATCVFLVLLLDLQGVTWGD
jgi:hypothetical protein